ARGHDDPRARAHGRARRRRAPCLCVPIALPGQPPRADSRCSAARRCYAARTALRADRAAFTLALALASGCNQYALVGFDDGGLPYDGAPYVDGRVQGLAV